MIAWLKTHKLTALLVVLIIYFLFGSVFSSLFGLNMSRVSLPTSQKMVSPSMGSSFGALEMAPSGVSSIGYAPVPRDSGIAADVAPENRLVIQNSNLSLLVSDVRETGDKIVKYAKDAGGFMVNVSYNRPEESPFATITVRVPSSKLDEALSFYRSQAIKVSNENLVGEDVTDQYVDIETRLSQLEAVRSKFESILESATEVQDILTVEREILNTQAQIDSLKGQQKSLEDNASFARLTVYLSTDELSLPYTPDTKFRPNVVFKLAVRSLLNSLRMVGEWAIWILVYGVIWVPIVLIYLGYRRWQSKKLVK